MPSLRLIQAPVFHGYSFSAWVEFEGNPGVEAIESGLAGRCDRSARGDFEPPTNVGQAGQSGIAVGAITPDRNNPEACWFWLVADNVRLAAENAVAVARQIDVRLLAARSLHRCRAAAFAALSAGCGYHVGGQAT